MSAEPVLRIGEVDGPEEYTFFRTSWAGFLSGRRIAVLNAGTFEVRIYDLDGAHQLSFGREGEGPGEFQGPSAGVVLPGDTIVIQDRDHLEFFTARGDFVRQVRIRGGRPFPWPRLMGRSGRRLVFLDGDLEHRHFRFDGRGLPSGLPDVQEGLDRGRYAVVAYDTDGVLLDTLSTSFGAGEAWIRPRENAVGYTTVPFGRGQHWAVGESGLVTGYTAEPVLRFFNGEGTLTQVSRVPFPTTVATESDFWAYFERTFGQESAEARTRVRVSYEAMPKYPSLPLFGSIDVDELGAVWVRSYSPTGFDSAPRWFVVSSTGVFLGEVALRPRIRIDEITRDLILGRESDELGVERVVLYRISRSGG